MAIAFNGATKRITLGAGTTSLSVLALWSRACDWMAEDDNSKYGEIMTQVGGEIPKIPIYLFLLNGWRIVPQQADHTLTVTDGVLEVEGGGDPFVDPAGAWKIRINRETPGIAIGYSTNGVSGPSADDVAVAVAQRVVEGGLTLEQILRIVLAAAAGTTDGAGTPTERFYGRDGATARVITSFDAAGNRAVVALNGS